MSHTYTATYTRIEAGYMGQVVEWLEVVTEGKDLEDYRHILKDVLREMALAYQQQKWKFSSENQSFQPTKGKISQ